jgi:hypothetical protein
MQKVCSRPLNVNEDAAEFSQQRFESTATAVSF